VADRGVLDRSERLATHHQATYTIGVRTTQGLAHAVRVPFLSAAGCRLFTSALMIFGAFVVRFVVMMSPLADRFSTTRVVFQEILPFASNTTVLETLGIATN
jgi:hypothetical protein